MPQRFHDWIFSDDLITARSDAGVQVRFTRQEHLLLARFIAAPGILLDRERLLDALPHQDTRDGGGERHVDYLVNRLRRRLGDTARNPRFIATQYGQGYRWIARAAPAVDIDAFLVLLPLHRHMPPATEALMRALCDALDERIVRPPGTAATALAPHGWRPAPDAQAAYLLELSAWADTDTLHLALMLRDARARQPLHPLRIARPLAAYGRAAAREDATALADALHPHIWAHRALAPETDAPTQPPLELRLHEATSLFADPTISWRDTLHRLDAHGHLLEHPPVRDITRAMVLYTRIVQQSFHAQCLSIEEWDALEADIENLVLPHLPAIAGQPLLELAASRLLAATGGRHFDTAFALARAGFAGTTAFATAFSTLGQCHAYLGQFDSACDLYERGIELAEPGSEFHVYLLVLQCIVHLGRDDRPALAQTRQTLFDTKPGTRQELGIMLYDVDSPLPADLAAALPFLDKAMLRHLLQICDRKTRNFFRNPRHRANLMRGFVSHVAHHAGPDAVPADLRGLIVPV